MDIKLVSSKLFALEVDFGLLQNSTIDSLPQMEIFYSQLSNCSTTCRSTLTAKSCRMSTEIGRFKLNQSTYVFGNLFPGTFYRFGVIQTNKRYLTRYLEFKTKDCGKYDFNI